MTRLVSPLVLLFALAAGCSGGGTAEPNDPPADNGSSSSGGDPQSSGGPGASSSSSGGAANQERFCFTRPRLELCEDFDENELPGAFSEARGGANMAIFDGDTATPPRALRLTTVGAEGSIDHRLITREFTARTKLRSMTQVKFAERAVGSSDDALRLLSHSFQVEGGSYRYSLATNDKGEWFAEELWSPSEGEPSSRRFPLTRGIEPNQWTTVRYQIDVDGNGKGTVKILIGLEQVSPTIDMATPSGPLASTYSLGLDGQAPAQAWTAEFDTVTFYFE